jgi:hypothetical protein
METFGMISAIKILGNFGTIGLVILIWWVDSRRYASLLDTYRNDMTQILGRMKEDTDKHWMMYEKNVSLVKDYAAIADNQQDIIILNTQAMTKLVERLGK